MNNILAAIATSPALAAKFTDSDTESRAWDKGSTLAIVLNENGTLSLLDSDGCPSNHALSVHHAEHLANDNNLNNWDYFASANN